MTDVKTMENENIIKFAKEMSQEILDKGKKVMPMCLLFKKDGNIEIIGMDFEGYEDKEKARTDLKNYLVGKSIDKYTIIFDAKMTVLNKNGKNVPKVRDIIMISIYTAKDKITRGFPYYEDKQLLENDKDTIKLDGRKDSKDCWDIWGEEVPFDTKEQKEYQEYKQAHRELYKGIDRNEDEIHEIKTNGEKEIVNFPLKFYMEIYRYKGKALFEAFNQNKELFFATPVINNDKEFQEALARIKDVLTRLGKNLERRK